MSSQKSELPILPKGLAIPPQNGPPTAPSTAPPTPTHTTHQAVAGSEKPPVAKPHLGRFTDEESSFAVDPYASPAVYYGESHAPRKPVKSRTLSSVSPPHSPTQPPRTPRSPHSHERRFSLPSVAAKLTAYHTQIEHSRRDKVHYDAPARRTSHGTHLAL
jgi:hypothetical protein